MTNTAEEAGAVSVSDGTGDGLIAFLNWTINKNEMVEATASALRTGCQKVLSIEENPGALDLRTADLDNIVNRFRIKHRLEMKDRTLDQYEQRFRQSVEMYMKWLNHDPSWKPAVRKRAASTNGTAGASKPSSRPSEPASPAAPPAPVEQHQPGMIKYPFPIRPGLQGSITLPEDLTMREAKRIAAFVSTLALEEEEQPRAITPGHFHNGE